MNILITICGRAGSKGIRNKNIRLFLGAPLINYTVVAAKLFSEKNKKYSIDICVNSDSEELLKIATESQNVNAIIRPKELATDLSPKVPSIIYSTEHMEKIKNKKYDYVIDLDITSPLRKINDIENSLNKMIENEKLDAVYSVVPSRRNPYFNMVERNKNGKIAKVKEGNFVRRQDTPEVYDMNASIYCYRRESFVNTIKISPLEGETDIFLMEDTAVLDIDHEQDFVLMEILGKYFFEQKDFKELYETVSIMVKK